MNNYVIDFERVNYLTSHTNDGVSNSSYTQQFIYSISRRTIKEYLEIYIGYNPNEAYKIGNYSKKITNEEYNKIVNTLIYNRILILPPSVRDEKIDKIIND